MSEPPEGGGMRIIHNTALGVIVAATLAPLPARAADAPQLPPGISEFMYQLTVPKDLQPTQAEIALGTQLFNDKRLSVDNTVACQTCHDPANGFTDHRANNATSAGVGNQHG